MGEGGKLHNIKRKHSAYLILTSSGRSGENLRLVTNDQRGNDFILYARFNSYYVFVQGMPIFETIVSALHVS